MVQISIMAGNLRCGTVEETLDSVAAYGIRSVEFGLSCAGLPPLPDQIDPDIAARIVKALADRNISMAAVHGQYNIIDPDEQRRRHGMRRLGVLARACASLGTEIVTLSTGTRDPEDMWRRHPDNDSPAAWRELTAVMAEAALIAEDAGVLLAFEPEVNNVVDSARKARRLLDELRSPHVKVLIDGANLFHTGELPRMNEILDEAFELLGPDIVLAHAKDLSHDGDAGHEAAGHGLLNYDRYVALLDALGRDVPLILHSLSDADVAGCVAFLQSKGAQLGPSDTGTARS